MIDELKKKIRPVKEEDRGKLLTVSYSKLSLKDQCDYRYNEKYNNRRYSTKGSIATAVGSILHKGLELKGRDIANGVLPDLQNIKKIICEGCTEITDKGSEELIGLDTICAIYFNEWFAVDENTGMDMSQKTELFFDEVLPTRMIDPQWKIIGTEISFEFVYDERCIIHGFIDRVDQLVDDPNILKVVDYKSSKKVFRDADIKTPLQMVTYDLACLQLFGVLPTFHEYDFILLNKIQGQQDGVCSKGYLKRGLKKLDRILDSISTCDLLQYYKPKPSPLCYWCEFASDDYTPNADDKYANVCPYHSLWTPDNKTFKVNQPFEEE